MVRGEESGNISQNNILKVCFMNLIDFNMIVIFNSFQVGIHKNTLFFTLYIHIKTKL